MTVGKDPFGIREDRPTDWFEALYGSAAVDGTGVPWASMQTHPAFADWLLTHPLDGQGRTALVVGCGMGDDAVELERRGFAVTAFDVSPSAIAFCRNRFSESSVDFVTADLLQDQPHWRGAFDFVLEIYTVQALPPAYEADAIAAISGYVAPGGTLLVVAETSTAARDFERGPPWLLTRDHVAGFEGHGLEVTGQKITPGALNPDNAQYVTRFERPSR